MMTKCIPLQPRFYYIKVRFGGVILMQQPRYFIEVKTIIENESNKSYWKFNNSLLKDMVYIKIVQKTIVDVFETYKN